MSQVTVKFSPKQTIAWKTLQEPTNKTVLYGGAKGGGKSVFGCWWVFLKCLELIKRFNLQPRKYPIAVCFMGRKQNVDFSDTTLETWKMFIPENYYELRPSDQEIIIQGTLKIQYGGFDNKYTVKKFNSAEYVYAFIDQAEEISRDDYGLLRGTMRRKINDTALDYTTLLTANPDACWLVDEFINQVSVGNAFVQALPSDNPFLPEDYIDNLKEAFKHRPELVKAYVYGDWDVLSGANLIIKANWARESINREIDTKGGRRVVACDPARFGDDETVIYVLEEGKVLHTMIYGQKSTMETAGNLMALKNKFQASLIAVDGVGIGSGIVDRCRELRAPVIDVNFAETASTDAEEDDFVNRRAEAYVEASNMFAEGLVSIPEDMTLFNQLTNIQYKIGSKGRWQIESKDDIKKRMSGKSPDRADALVIGLHALKFVHVKRRDFSRLNRPTSPRDKYGWRSQGAVNAA